MTVTDAPETPDLILWLDMETLDLGPLTCPVVEAAFVLTDGAYKPVETADFIVWPEGGVDWETVPKFVVDMHTASGLRDLIDGYPALAVSLGTVELDVVSMLQRYGLYDVRIPYAGSGVAAFDRQIIAHRMPLLDKHLTYYPDPDVGVLRRTFRRWGLEWELPGEIPHRAMPDVRRSIEEATHYRDLLLELDRATPL